MTSRSTGATASAFASQKQHFFEPVSQRVADTKCCVVSECFMRVCRWTFPWYQGMLFRDTMVTWVSPGYVIDAIVFDILQNYENLAQPVDESKYPWLARVVHSMHHYGPHMCTASCVEPAVFITSARCLFGIKIRYTTLIYQKFRLKVRAFVISSKPTRQMYDDIGFIVTQPNKEVKQWEKVKLFKKVNRTDEQFYWFDGLEPASYRVVGFAMQKALSRITSANNIYNLTQLDVTVGTDLCSTILTFEKRLKGYSVPCYHSCTLDEYREHTNSVLKVNSKSKFIKKCLGYHGVEGGAVIEIKSGDLFGVATWGGYSTTHVMMIELPVGFTVPNSKSFFEDWRCAKRIAADSATKPTAGHYQKLCDDKK